MARTIATLFLILVTLAPLHGADREIFPDDYTPSPCAPPNACVSYKPSEIVLAGARIHGLTYMKPPWVSAHWDELVTAFAPYCAKVRTCYAQPGNTNLFCDDQLMETVVSICDRYPEKSEDREQCIYFYRAYVSGVQLNSEKPWLEAQACAKASAKPNQPLRKLEVWTKPAVIPLDFKGKLMIYAIDSETRVPIQASYTIADENLWADTPGGRPATGFPLKWKTKLVRSPNKDGHRDAVPPTVTVVKDGYETVKFPLPIAVRKMVADMTPPVSAWKRGTNKITVNVRDAVTGKPVDARVMVGQRDTADAGVPFDVEWKRGGKRPEIWVRSTFDLYSDVVVAPAGK